MAKSERGLVARLGLKLLGRSIYRVRGWHFEPLPDYWERKQVIIAFPHLAWADTAMAFSGFAMTDQKGHNVIKKEAFRGLFSPVLKWLGGVPIDRTSRTGLVAQLVAEFNKRDVFQLAIVPEGTRKGTTKLKTGFWHIAKGADVQIVCWYIDNKHHTTRWVGAFRPGDDLQQDLQLLKQMYAGVGHEITSV